MRIGGPFVYGQPAVSLQMAGGAVWYPPAGNYMMSLGSQSVVQWFDPVQLLWRNLATGISSDPFDLSTDGYSWRIVNASGIVQGATITTAGSGATVNGIGTGVTGVTVTFGSAPSNGFAATAYPIIGGQIGSSITITQAGSGFLSPPLILIDPPPPGGIQATATCTINSSGAIGAVTVTNQGAGYTSVPNVYVMPQYATFPGIGVPVNPAGPPANIIPPGLIGTNQPPWLPNINWGIAPGTTGALLTAGALTGSGTLTGIVITDYGVGYAGTTIPTITISGGGIGGSPAATALMSMALSSVTITGAGTAYPSGSNNMFESNLGLVLAATSIINNNVVGPRCARGQANCSSTTVSSTVIEDAGFGFQKLPVLAVVQQSGTPATSQANLTAVTGGVTDVIYVQPAVQQ
jgi:hypothetical protein